MVEGKQREAWDHTSALIAMLFNCQRGKHDKALSPAQFNPFLMKAARKNRPKIKDVRFLAGLMGATIPEKPVAEKDKAQ
jgi:hypothetical protein